MTSDFPVAAYLTAVRRQGSPELPERSRTFLVLSRRNVAVTVEELDESRYGVFDALAAGVAIGAARASVAPDRVGADEVRRWISGWVSEGCLRM